MTVEKFRNWKFSLHCPAWCLCVCVWFQHEKTLGVSITCRSHFSSAMGTIFELFKKQILNPLSLCLHISVTCKFPHKKFPSAWIFTLISYVKLDLMQPNTVNVNLGYSTVSLNMATFLRWSKSLKKTNNKYRVWTHTHKYTKKIPFCGSLLVLSGSTEPHRCVYVVCNCMCKIIGQTFALDIVHCSCIFMVRYDDKRTLSLLKSSIQNNFIHIPTNL